MATTTEIVKNLHKLVEEKKIILSERYVEHSNWLTKEFLQLRGLIQQDARLPLSESVDQITNDDSDAIEETENLSRQKRKSREICADGTRTSPDPKRISGDSLELPKDLNKLKKEDLLVELEKRGVTTMTMKSLKKDLVDALKDLIAKEASDKEEVKIDKVTNSSSSSEIHSNQVISSTATGRKGSLMSEFRTLVNKNQTVTATQETPSERQARVERGFHERMGRHRESTARQSAVTLEGIIINVDSTTAPATSEDSMNVKTNIVGFSHFDPVVKSSAPSDIQGASSDSPASKQQPESTWMEVESPPRDDVRKPSMSAPIASPKPTFVPPSPPKTGNFVTATIKSLFSPSGFGKKTAPPTSTVRQRPKAPINIEIRIL